MRRSAIAALIGATILVGAPLLAETAMGCMLVAALASPLLQGSLLARRLRVEPPAGTRRESWQRCPIGAACGREPVGDQAAVRRSAFFAASRPAALAIASRR